VVCVAVVNSGPDKRLHESAIQAFGQLGVRNGNGKSVAVLVLGREGIIQQPKEEFAGSPIFLFCFMLS